MNSTEAYWRGRHVLITGHEGFLGSNLTRKMISYGADVVGLDINTDREQTLFTEQERKCFKGIRGNVANRRLVEDILINHGTEDVFHLAAESLVGNCKMNPRRAFTSNIQGTWNILECCRQSGTIQAIVAASSDKAYGSHEDLPYLEDTSLIGDHPYDVSKSCADLIANAYFNTYGLPVVVTRCGNIYGPGDFNFSRLIPDSIRCALSGKTIKIRSDGLFTRDYVYVDDIVEGYILLAEKMKNLSLAGEAFNISAEKPYSVIEVVDMVYRSLDLEPKYVILDEANHEICHQYLSSDKISRRLGWEAEYPLESGLKKAINWYGSFLTK